MQNSIDAEMTYWWLNRVSSSFNIFVFFTKAINLHHFPVKNETMCKNNESQQRRHRISQYQENLSKNDKRVELILKNQTISG
jgi:hypothetical protein